MMDNKNIPDTDQFWTGAEKLLDDHFRKRRIVKWLLVLIIPSLLAGLSYLYFSNPKPDAGKIASSAQDTKINVSSTREINTLGHLNKQNDRSANTIPSKPESVNSDGKKISMGQPAGHTGKSKSVNHKINSVVGTSLTKRESKPGENFNPKDALTLAAVDKKRNSDSFTGYPDKQNNIVPAPGFTTNKDPESLHTLVPFTASLVVDIPQKNVTGNILPPYISYTNKHHVGWMLNIYGSAQYVQKTISANVEPGSYLQHRQNEEKAVITPGLGMSVSAGSHPFSVSVGIEYSVSGEKTNYYPYSLQSRILDNGIWQTYFRNYIDTDTAFVMGNRYFMQTNRSVLDSSYNSHMDTIQEYRYDKLIAEKNGVNRIYYIEVPLEISYTLTKGRAGIGISAGISPAWMIQERGNYLRLDGHGIESFDEIKSFRTFMLNGRAGVNIYYRVGARTNLMLRPQYKANLNSVFKDNYPVKQKYNSTGVLFGISYMLN